MIAATTEDAMRCTYRWLAWVGIALLGGAGDVHAAGKLGVFDAWIRAAPPGASMVAGYATLKNTGDEPIAILTVQSDAFRMTSLHETRVEEGVSKMRELHRLKVAPGETIQLRPGGKHLMLMQPRRDIVAGDKVEMLFMLVDGARVETYFDVVAADSSGG
jgi:copper(I)-binding protein